VNDFLSRFLRAYTEGSHGLSHPPAGENRFHLDYRHPFNALQAFSLALSALDL
jgi:hypothetical protein